VLASFLFFDVFPCGPLGFDAKFVLLFPWMTRFDRVSFQVVYFLLSRVVFGTTTAHRDSLDFFDVRFLSGSSWAHSILIVWAISRRADYSEDCPRIVERSAFGSFRVIPFFPFFYSSATTVPPATGTFKKLGGCRTVPPGLQSKYPPSLFSLLL